jgi:hypothetical protein
MKVENSLAQKVVSDSNSARNRFELYEKFYLSLNEKGIKYLRSESIKYKRCLSDIQDLILPGVKKICPTCNIVCCKLHCPDLSIYIADTVGGFTLNDYMLVRCDQILPNPQYGNVGQNLCPFWDNGCRLPVDCRSYMCIQYFCDNLKKELDLEAIEHCLGNIRQVLDSFSVGKCMI